MQRFDKAIGLIDAANAEDPRKVESNGEAVPSELLYSRRMTETLQDLYPEATELLQLAVRAQHIQRWAVPRDAYPMDRAGYHRWRNDLKRRHSELAGKLLSEAGYEEEEIARVRSIIEKRALRTDPDSQALEDTACIVFLRHYAEEFAAKHDDEKMVGIIRKTWGKMSADAHAAASEFVLSPRLTGLVQKALQDPAET